MAQATPHKTTVGLVREYDKIVVGNVNSKKIMKPAAADRQMAKSVADANFRRVSVFCYFHFNFTKGSKAPLTVVVCSQFSVSLTLCWNLPLLKFEARG